MGWSTITTGTQLATTGTQLATTGTPLVSLASTGYKWAAQLGTFEYHWYCTGTLWSWGNLLMLMKYWLPLEYPWNTPGKTWELICKTG
jgi:hypothetical protein